MCTREVGIDAGKPVFRVPLAGGTGREVVESRRAASRGSRATTSHLHVMAAHVNKVNSNELSSSPGHQSEGIRLFKY